MSGIPDTAWRCRCPSRSSPTGRERLRDHQTTHTPRQTTEDTVTNFPDVNRAEVDYTRLLDPAVMATFTNDRQGEHHADTLLYERMLASIESALRAQVIPGDGRFSARRRARRVTAPLRALVKHSRGVETALEQLRGRTADHHAHVQALPAQREAKQLRKAGRRDQLAALTAKSLHKSASAFTPGSEETTAAPAADTGRPAARGITDLFNQQRRGA
ncbi:hypothetical protein ACIQTN_33950 [Streptomyces werraensis]|uniref:hypothetical protein n=1 Tax=Streptomyces werraensis TaxID=68284 RepID=UPI003802F8C2